MGEELRGQAAYTLGHENAGWVHEVGSAVTNVAPGDNGDPPPTRDLRALSGLPRRRRRALHQQRLPRNLRRRRVRGPAEDHRSLRREARPDVASQGHRRAGGRRPDRVPRGAKAAPLLYPGTKVVVIGSGGLGHIGIQSLRALTPAEIIVVDPSERALALAGELGADHTVQADGRHVDTVLQMTDGAGAEVIIDFVGEKGAIEDGVAMLRQAGSYFVIGYGENINVPTIDIISREINFIGNLVGSYILITTSTSS